MTSAPLSLLVAALAGGLVVYLYFTMKPAGYDEPADVIVGGVSIQQVAGAGGARPRILLAIAALVVCLIFIAGSLSTLP